MTNVELKEKVEGIIAIEDYFDRAIAISNFDKEYKCSNFFKITKKPLEVLIREFLIFKLINPANIKITIQKILNELDFEHVKEIIDELGEAFGQENEELLESLEEIKKLVD